MGGETLAAENEVELEVLVVRSRPSCLMLSSTGWAAVTSFQSCWRSEGHTATHGEEAPAVSGRRGSPPSTRAPGWRGMPWALPTWHSSAPKAQTVRREITPKAGHSPLCWHPGSKGCTAPVHTPKQAARSVRGAL